VSGDRAASPSALDEEDRARADLYALLARLYYRGPDAQFLEWMAQTGAADGGDNPSTITRAWKSLWSIASGIDPAVAQQEHDDLFVGTGRAEISPYATFYLAETGREKILVGLRRELDAMGLSRKEAAREPEDHFAGLFDVMRHLVEQGSGHAALQDQRGFFERYLLRSYAAFCDTIEKSGRAEFYGRVAALTRAFLDVEKEALYMV
jgi:TorA maturation chaperone TorD